MMLTNRELARQSKLLELIYTGMTAQSRWTTDILPAIADYLQVSSCVLFTPFHKPQESGFLYTHGISPQQVQLYKDHYRNEDIYAKAALSRGLLVEGNVIIFADILPAEQLHASKYYREYLVREDMAQLMSAIVFGPDSDSGMPLTVCSFWRGINADPYTEQERIRLNLLIPHISRALGASQIIRTSAMNSISSLSALDRLPSSGVLMVDESGKVIFANRAAQRILNTQDGLRLRKQSDADEFGELIAEDAQADKALRAALRTTLSHNSCITPHFSKSIVVPRSSAICNYTVQFSALVLDNELSAEERRFAAIVFISDSAKKLHIDPEILQSSYGLTPTEVRVAIALFESCSAKEVAKTLGTSHHTVRGHIKLLYTKLGVDTRARFIKLLLGIAL